VIARLGSPRVLARRTALGTLAASVAVVGLPAFAQAAPPTTPFISEIHYDDVGADIDEFVHRWAELYDDRMRGGTIEEHLSSITGATDVAEAARVRFEHLRRLLRPREDVVPTIAELRAQGLKIGLLSVCSADVAEVWSELGLGFDVEVYSCSEEVAKPDPRVYLLTAERLGVAPEDCLFVDDHDENLLGAERAGMRAVLIGPGDGGWDGTRIDAVSGVLELI
jgi:epoxide hydrolase-like predicted phosphatase